MAADEVKRSAAQMEQAADTAADAAESTAEAADETARAATATKHAAEKTKDSADRRTELAGDRTIYAAERTYAAWVRTGLAALASGVGAQKLLQGVVPHWLTVSTGTLLVLFSAFCFGAAVWRQITPGPQAPFPEAQRLPPALLVVVNGFLGLVALAALVGIWFGRQT